MCASALRAQAAPEAGKIHGGRSGKTYVLDSAVDIEKISIASAEIAECVPVNNRAVMINGKAPGETSAIVWLSDGTRKEYTVIVTVSASKLEAAKAQIEKEFGGTCPTHGRRKHRLSDRNGQEYIRIATGAGRLRPLVGKVVNLLKVEMPPQEQEILIKVKFADVDRSKSLALGANILGTPGGFPFNVTTGANSPSRFTT